MKICFFGSSLVSSYWNGAATYYRGILKALSALGHEIAFYEPDAFERQSHRDIANPEWAEVVVYPATSEGWQRSLEHAVASADLLVKASGVGVFDRELEVAVAETPTRARRVYWDVDAPATLDEIAANPAHHLRKAIPRYDVVFTYGGGAPVVDGVNVCPPHVVVVMPTPELPTVSFFWFAVVWSTSLTSPGVICVLGGMSRAATTTCVVGIGAGASDFCVWA